MQYALPQEEITAVSPDCVRHFPLIVSAADAWPASKSPALNVAADASFKIEFFIRVSLLPPSRVRSVSPLICGLSDNFDVNVNLLLRLNRRSKGRRIEQFAGIACRENLVLTQQVPTL